LIPIDPVILQEERKFQQSQRGGLQVTIPVDDSAEEGGDNSGGESEGDYQRSVATIDSIAENADFVSFLSKIKVYLQLRITFSDNCCLMESKLSVIW
jgi:hypothetical protein